MLRFRSIALLLAAAMPMCASAILTVQAPAGNIKAGTTFILTVNMSNTAGSGAQAIQFSLNGIGWPLTSAIGSVGAGKTLQCAAVGNAINCLVEGTMSVLQDGVLATLSISIPANQPAGTITATMNNQVAAATDAVGNIYAVPVVAASPFPLSITSLPSCDLNGDGKFDALDLALMKSQILKVTACTNGDLNSDGACNALDGQILENAVATSSCVAH